MDKSSTLTAYEFYKKFNVAEKKFSIFDELVNEENDESCEPKKSKRQTIPFDEVIKEPPKNHEDITKVFQEQLHLKNNLKYVTLDDQKILADALKMAIIAIWPEHRKQGPDPFLSDIGNKELQRRIAVYIAQTAEELFYSYITKAEEINHKVVFSAEANLTRLKTQIVHEANMRLNVSNVRRKLAEHMRHAPDEKWFQQGNQIDSGMLYPDFTPLDIKTKKVMEKGHQQFIKKQLDQIEQHINRIEPSLDPLLLSLKMNEKKNISAVDEHSIDASQSAISVVTDLTEESIPESSDKILDGFHENGVFIQRSSSMPNLLTDSESLEEFGEMQVIRNERKQSADQLLHESLGTRSSSLHHEEVNSPFPVNEDIEPLPMEDDFSPLLQVQQIQPKRKSKRIKAEYTKLCCDEENLLVDGEQQDEKDDLFEDEERMAYPAVLQPSTVNLKIPGKGIARICDVSVSTRINESVLTLHKFPTMYNEFMGEIDDATVNSLDEHLFAGKLAQEVYDEITKTTTKDFLCFDKDDFVEECAQVEDTQSLFMSQMLQGKQKSHLVSEELRLQTDPPWMEFKSNEEWINEPRFSGLGREEILKMQVKSRRGNSIPTSSKNLSVVHNDSTFPIPQLSKSYSAWLSWYKTHLNSDDYKKFLYTKENDYLCQLFHLYDSEDSEDEIQENLQNKTLELKIIEQKQRKFEIQREKNHYEKGFWNTQCVSLGGLGKDPDLSESEQAELPDEEKVISEQCLQERIERIWKLLKVPDQMRVDMAMRYSGYGGTEKLIEAIGHWEKLADLIIERECLMAKLEGFERSASDPNRFFQKGPTGSSVTRINEAKTRAKLIQSIKSLEEEIVPFIAFMSKRFGDVATYQGRPYSQKLQCDRVEMLYWLQQERRDQALNAHNLSDIRDVTPITCIEINPLHV